MKHLKPLTNITMVPYETLEAINKYSNGTL